MGLATRLEPIPQPNLPLERDGVFSVHYEALVAIHALYYTRAFASETWPR